MAVESKEAHMIGEVFGGNALVLCELLVLTFKLRGQRLSELHLLRYSAPYLSDEIVAQSPLLGHHFSLLCVLITLLISVNKCHPID